MEKQSFLTMRSSPKKILMIPLLQNAAGRRAAVFRPSRPSERRSVANPHPKAIIMLMIGLMLDGRHRIIVGSIVSRI
jgi:hypothetical protein